MNQKNLLKIQKQAERWAREAGRLLQDYKNKFSVKVKKDPQDIATTADLDSEKLLINLIHKAFPNHNILSEEKGLIQKRSLYTWIIDPLDGTKEYVRKIPDYTVNLALEYEERTILAVVFRPETNDIFSVSKQNGARFNNKAVHISPQKNFKDSFLYTHLPDYRMSKKRYNFAWKILSKIARNCYRLRGFSVDVLSLCFVAMGACEGYILITEKDRYAPKWWDVAAGLLMVEEAGGKVTDIYGKPIKNRDLSKGIVATNGKIHEELLKYLK